MAREINLLIKREGQLTLGQKRQLEKVKLWVPAGLVIYLIGLLIIVSANIYVNLQNKALTEKIKTTSTAIQNLTQNEGIYLILNQKLQAITKILSGRYAYLDIFDFFKNLEIDNGRIYQVLLETSGKTQLTFSLNDSEAMDRVVTSIVSQAKARFKSVKLESVRLAEAGGYVIELHIQV